MKKQKVLVIDNDPDTVEIISIVLQEEAHLDVVGLKDLPGVDLIEAISPNLIIVDELLNNTRGSIICTEIKQKRTIASIPVLLMSALHNIEKIANGCNADGYIQKPFDIDYLTSLVKFALGKNRVS